MSVTEQLEQGAAAIRQRHNAERFIAYFQSYPNTDDSVDRLEQRYREALAFPAVAGLAIATRPDCLAEDTLDILAQLARHTYLWLEPGLASMRDRTLLERLNPEIVMHRLCAEAHRAITIAPAWSVNKHGMHNRIHRELTRCDVWQGRLYTKPEFRTSLPSMSNEGAVL